MIYLKKYLSQKYKEPRKKYTYQEIKKDSTYKRLSSYSKHYLLIKKHFQRRF